MDKTFKPQFDLDAYREIRDQGASWIWKKETGVISVSGGEAVQFLNGLVTNDIAKLEDGNSILAAFPNAKGRLIAVVRVDREGESYVFETEAETFQTVLTNLERFTFAGDFKVEDLTQTRSVFRICGEAAAEELRKVCGDAPAAGETLRVISFGESDLSVRPLERIAGFSVRGETDTISSLVSELRSSGAVEADGPLAEVLRVESGIPIFGKDMDEETVIPEIGLEGLISYEKGCYIGQEVIARIHFRGKVAKELKGVVFEAPEALANPGDELLTKEGKNAGYITSKAFSPKLKKHIAMAYIRNAFTEAGTELRQELQSCRVVDLPFITD